MNRRTSKILHTTEQVLERRTGRMTLAGDGQPSDARMATIEVGMSCKDVALSAKSMEEA